MTDPVGESTLLTSLAIRGVTLRNRIMLAPMCMYSSHDGLPSDFDVLHLGARALGGAAVVLTGATAVESRGRITPSDLGIWSDAHTAPLARLASVIESYGALPGVQLAHAGRKASTKVPWAPVLGPLAPEDGGWSVVAPSPLPFGPGDFPVPHELTAGEIADIISAWAAAARRSREAGFKVIEIHAGHGYLHHEFYSPVSNQRTDSYGGSFENRTRFTLEVVDAIRTEWPEELPLFIRISSTDWIEDRPSWTLSDSIELARLLSPRGVDLIDCSSGSLFRLIGPKESPGYQVPFAEKIRRETGVLTAAVGMITEPAQAEEIIATGKADIVALGRVMLADPNWPLRAAQTLGVEAPWPRQYLLARQAIVR